MPNIAQSQIEHMIADWLHSKRNRSGSERTAVAYQSMLSTFRDELQRTGLDLDASDAQALALLIHDWASRPHARTSKPVSPATRCLRLAVLSSFYTFARRHGLHTQSGDLVTNPLEWVERPAQMASIPSQTAPLSDITGRLNAIDRSDFAGKRDYALLSVLLVTGCRLSEVAVMRWEHVTLQRDGCIVTFPRTKGGKTIHHRLPASTTNALVDWLTSIYEPDVSNIAPETPLWISLAEYNKTFGHPLSIRAIALICEKRLGTSRTEALRKVSRVYAAQVMKGE